MGFQKGCSGNTGGRPKGAINKKTREIRALAGNLFDATYWKNAHKRLKAGKMHPAIEKVLLAYAYGEPKKTVRLEGEVGVLEKRRALAHLPDDVVEMLAARAAVDDDEADDVEGVTH